MTFRHDEATSSTENAVGVDVRWSPWMVGR